MRVDNEIRYWFKNEEWYRFNEVTDEYELTDVAPESARESFRKFREYEEQCKAEGRLCL